MIKCSECICLVNGFCHRFAPIPYYEYFSVHCKAPDQQMYGHVVWPKIRNPNEDGCGEGVMKIEILTQKMKNISKGFDAAIEAKNKEIKKVEETLCLQIIKQAEDLIRSTE